MGFVLWELRREAKNQSVLLPMSMWTQPGAKMGPIILLVFFGWWGFNTLSYFVPLFFQEVQLLNPLQTAVRLVPMGVSVSLDLALRFICLTMYLQGLITNIATGYLIAVVPGQILVMMGLFFALVCFVTNRLFHQPTLTSVDAGGLYCFLPDQGHHHLLGYGICRHRHCPSLRYRVHSRKSAGVLRVSGAFTGPRR